MVRHVLAGMFLAGRVMSSLAADRPASQTLIQTQTPTQTQDGRVTPVAVSMQMAKPQAALALGLSTVERDANEKSASLIKRHQIPYANVWADDQGRTHVAMCTLTGLALHGFAPPAAPYYMGIAPENIKSIVFSVIPVGWYGKWHHAPGPQWVIDLSGQWEVKTADGTTLRQGPGQFQFNSDQDAFAETSGDPVGHTARQVGDVPDVRLIITLKKRPGRSYTNQPCLL